VYFLGVKAASVWGWQPYHHPVPLSLNLGNLTSWNPLGHSRPVTGLLHLYLNFLEPSGPLQACNGTASPFLHDLIYSQLPSISEAVPPSATGGRAIPSWHGHIYYLLWLLSSGIPRDAYGQPHAHEANRHCQCPRSLPKMSREFPYKCLMSDLMQHEISVHLESMTGVLPLPFHTQPLQTTTCSKKTTRLTTRWSRDAETHF